MTDRPLPDSPPTPGTPPEPARMGTAFSRLCDVVARLRAPEEDRLLAAGVEDHDVTRPGGGTLGRSLRPALTVPTPGVVQETVFAIATAIAAEDEQQALGLVESDRKVIAGARPSGVLRNGRRRRGGRGGDRYPYCE